MPSKPWDRDIASERYHIQTLRLIRFCVLLGSDAIRCLIGMGLSAACVESKQAGRKEGSGFLTAVVGPVRCGRGSQRTSGHPPFTLDFKLRNT
jgi:hypothetical protein